jgi:hypothetical protein
MSQTTDKIFDPSTENIPTPVRINAVDYYVRKEPILTTKMRDQTVKVRKRDGTVMSFSIDVFEIACQLHKEGHDALKIGKSEILTIARNFIGVAPSTISPKQHAPSISDRSADMASRAVHNLIFDAARLESSRDGGDAGVAAKLSTLMADMGFNGQPNTPAVVPYTLVLSASQLASIHPKLVQFKSQFEEIIAHFQAQSIDDNA